MNKCGVLTAAKPRHSCRRCDPSGGHILTVKCKTTMRYCGRGVPRKVPTGRVLAHSHVQGLLREASRRNQEDRSQAFQMTGPAQPFCCQPRLQPFKAEREGFSEKA